MQMLKTPEDAWRLAQYRTLAMAWMPHPFMSGYYRVATIKSPSPRLGGIPDPAFPEGIVLEMDNEDPVRRHVRADCAIVTPTALYDCLAMLQRSEFLSLHLGFPMKLNPTMEPGKDLTRAALEQVIAERMRELMWPTKKMTPFHVARTYFPTIPTCLFHKESFVTPGAQSAALDLCMHFMLPGYVPLCATDMAKPEFSRFAVAEQYDMLPPLDPVARRVYWSPFDATKNEMTALLGATMPPPPTLPPVSSSSSSSGVGSGPNLSMLSPAQPLAMPWTHSRVKFAFGVEDYNDALCIQCCQSRPQRVFPCGHCVVCLHCCVVQPMMRCPLEECGGPAEPSVAYRVHNKQV